MSGTKQISTLFILLSTLACLVLRTEGLDLRNYRNSLEARYSTAHSLGDSYVFDSRDGWETVNTTNLAYKYARSDLDDPDDTGLEDDYGDPHLQSRATKKSSPKPKSAKKKTSSKTASKPKAQSKSATSSVTDKLKSALAGLKGVGKSEPVTITWYTGHDLQNPSCWSNPTWAPTDSSFACALTLDGWTTRPKCFKFLELCNTPQKCVYVRVVDSCAGCAKGSKHVDLTQAAFTELASLDEGLLQVQMRQATEPDNWLENLWGPQH